jgi:hypothetical protein
MKSLTKNLKSWRSDLSKMMMMKRSLKKRNLNNLKRNKVNMRKSWICYS